LIAFAPAVHGLLPSIDPKFGRLFRVMSIFCGQSAGPLLILHGGAHTGPPDRAKLELAVRSLVTISQSIGAELGRREVCDVVVAGLQAMEADPVFNAGLGGALQADGEVRVSAGLMDGARQAFSGVINALEIKHPSVIARWLQDQPFRVLSQPGVQTLARDLKLPSENLVTSQRLAEWRQRMSLATSDTVGCVFRNGAGALAAGTSTGGRECALPGRVSDSATVAGNYASAFVAVSATGIGEEIVDDALAARLETRCRDGMSLEAAARRCYEEALERGRSYGWIAVHRNGEWNAAHTTPMMSFLVQGEQGILQTSEPPAS
jgi:L-asparaginase